MTSLFLLPFFMTLKQDIEDLKKTIHKHDHHYYVKNSPSISDQEYDALLRRLRDLENANPENVSPDSPTQRVGGKVEERFKAVLHLVPMLSLDNTYNVEELKAFHQRVLKGLKDIPEATVHMFNGYTYQIAGAYICELENVDWGLDARSRYTVVWARLMRRAPAP